MTDAHVISASLWLCDWAESINGKLYVQGAGWTRLQPDTPAHIAVAALIAVPYDQTNHVHEFQIVLVTEDGEPYPTEKPFKMEGQIEVGRPPGMMPGEGSQVPIAARLAGVSFPKGAYRFDIIANGLPICSASFVSRG